jgi:hypothetical protein
MNKMTKRSGSLLFDVILYIIAAAVVIGGIYFSFSFLKGQADVSTLTNNDSKVMMDTAASFKSGYYDSKGKYNGIDALTAKAWSPLTSGGTTGYTTSFYLSSKLDNECFYHIGPHDGGGGTVSSRYAVFIDCATAVANQNWTAEKINQLELAFANSFKSRIPDAVIDGETAGTHAAPPALPTSTAEIDATTVPNSDGRLYIKNLHE